MDQIQSPNLIGISGRIGSGKDTFAKLLQEAIIRRQDAKLDVNVLTAERREYFSGWQIKKYAAKLKVVASILTGFPIELFEDQEFKKKFLGAEWNGHRVSWLNSDDGPGSVLLNSYDEAVKYMEDGFEDGFDPERVQFEKMSVRTFIQKLGTEGIRNGIHQNAWVNALYADYRPLSYYTGPSVDGKGIYDVTEEDELMADLSAVYPNWLITDTRFPNEAQAIKDRDGIVVRIDRNLPAQEYTTLEQSLHPSETSLDSWEFDYTIHNNGSLEDLMREVEIFIDRFGLK